MWMMARSRPGCRCPPPSMPFRKFSCEGSDREVDDIANETSQRSLRRVFRVRIRLEGLDLERMRPGMSVKVVAEDRLQDALLVPRAAWLGGRGDWWRGSRRSGQWRTRADRNRPVQRDCACLRGASRGRPPVEIPGRAGVARGEAGRHSILVAGGRAPVEFAGARVLAGAVDPRRACCMGSRRIDDTWLRVDRRDLVLGYRRRANCVRSTAR